MFTSPKMAASKPRNAGHHLGPALDSTSLDTESLVQPHRRFSSLEMADELAGTLEFPNRPAITAGYADIYHGFWTSVQGERVEVAIKEFRALIPRDRQSDPEALRRRTETVGTFKCPSYTIILDFPFHCPSADKTRSVCLESDKASEPTPLTRLSLSTPTTTH